MYRVVHFEIPVQDPEATTTFYSNVFGWKIDHWEGPQDYWLITTGEAGTPGIDGGFYRPDGEIKGTVNTIGVDNLDEMLAKVQANGGQVVTPKAPIPGMGWFAYARDNGGNLFGLMQSDPTAA